MAKKTTSFPYGKIIVSGRDVPLNKDGGVNMRYLTAEEKKIYKKILEDRKRNWEILI
jgi:hypothetical protein